MAEEYSSSPGQFPIELQEEEAGPMGPCRKPAGLLEEEVVGGEEEKEQGWPAWDQKGLNQQKTREVLQEHQTSNETTERVRTEE